MGEEPMTSVTDPWRPFPRGRQFACVAQCSCPRWGHSIRCCWRVTDQPAPILSSPAGIEPGFASLFYGTEGSFSGWYSAGRGTGDGTVVACPRGGL